MATQQEHRGKKQQFDTKHNPSTPSSQTENEKQQNKDTRASMAQSKALSGEDHTQVAELAYALYEQRGRKDGHDLED